MTDTRQPTAREPATRPAGSGGTLARQGGAMAAGILASRVTGFVRTAMIVAALGSNTSLSEAYNVANTTPNIVYDLLLGGVLSSVVVPLLVRSAREDDDAGEGFTSTLFTLVTTALVLATVVGVLLAPLLMRIYLDSSVSAAERSTAVALTRFFLPQLLFYALSALMGAVLNLRGRFGVVGVAPVLNNVVVIVVAALFLTHPGTARATAHLTGGQSLLLGLGTTLGVVAMTVALLPSLARAGVRLRWRWGVRDPRLRTATRLGGWVLAYAAVNQIGFVVVTHLATGGHGRNAGGYTVYATAYQVFSLPYAIAAVSVVSALMPGLSRAAAEDDLAGVRAQLSRGIRLSAVLLLPAAVGLLVLAHPIATAAFLFGGSGVTGAEQIGTTLAVFAVGLPGFAGYQLLLRAFYARQDSRTPALVNAVVNVVNIVADVVAVAVLPAGLRIPGLAGGFVLSYLVGTGLAARLLRRPLGGLDGYRVVRLLVRVGLAAVLGAVLAGLVAAGLGAGLGHGEAASLLAVVVAAGLGAGVYVLAARRLRVREVTGLLDVVRRR